PPASPPVPSTPLFRSVVANDLPADLERCLLAERLRDLPRLRVDGIPGHYALSQAGPIPYDQKLQGLRFAPIVEPAFQQDILPRVLQKGLDVNVAQIYDRVGHIKLDTLVW